MIWASLLLNNRRVNSHRVRVSVAVFCVQTCDAHGVRSMVIISLEGSSGARKYIESVCAAAEGGRDNYGFRILQQFDEIFPCHGPSLGQAPPTAPKMPSAVLPPQRKVGPEVPPEALQPPPQARHARFFPNVSNSGNSATDQYEPGATSSSTASTSRWFRGPARQQLATV